jgi:hypothetical protein
MDFSQALIYLRAGYRARRRGWSWGGETWIHIGPNGLYFEQVGSLNSSFHPLSSDILATDWEIGDMDRVIPETPSPLLLRPGDLSFHNNTLEILRFTSAGELYYRGELVEGRGAEVEAVVRGLCELWSGYNSDPSPSCELKRRVFWDHLREAINNPDDSSQ